MTQTWIYDQYNDVLSTIFGPPATKKLGTEESIVVKFLNTLCSLIVTGGSLELTLNCSISFMMFYNTPLSDLSGYKVKKSEL